MPEPEIILTMHLIDPESEETKRAVSGAKHVTTFRLENELAQMRPNPKTVVHLREDLWFLSADDESEDIIP